jgi:hypothetical protein
MLRSKAARVLVVSILNVLYFRERLHNLAYILLYGRNFSDVLCTTRLVYEYALFYLQLLSY